MKQVDTGKTAGIHEDQEMYSASIAKLLYLYYTQKEINENHVDLQTPLKYIKEVNDIQELMNRKAVEVFQNTG